MEPGKDNPRLDDAGRQADDRLIHALLLHLTDEQSARQREGRVARAMAAIRGPAATQADDDTSSLAAARACRIMFPAWTRRAAWAAAAMVLLAGGLWLAMFNARPAMASLNDIIDAAGRAGDRTYRIRMEDLPEPPDRGPPDEPRPQAAPRPGLDNATLYLRDGRQYVLVRNDPKGGTILDGYDGRQSWRVRGGAVAEIKEGPGAGGIPMPPIMADVPFADLRQTLERMRTDYTVERLDQAPLPGGGEALRHVLVRRKSREVKGPETIEIWADARTATLKRIVFDRAKLQGNRQPCRLTFELIGEEALAADWFSAAAHGKSLSSDRP